jgi:hypothetical protein
MALNYIKNQAAILILEFYYALVNIKINVSFIYVVIGIYKFVYFLLFIYEMLCVCVFV